MTLYINCESISKSHGSQQLFSDISLSIFKGDHLGLIGPNGSGKSTLLKILAGIEKPNSGTVSAQKYLRVGFIPQESAFPPNTVNEIIMQALAEETKSSEHERQITTSILLGKMGFENPHQKATELSGGWKKRLEIAKQLAKEPDLLLLDEPTNHLDLEGVLWLEKLLNSSSFSFVVVTHDRTFLQNVSKRLVELNAVYADGYLSVNGKYSDFLLAREQYLTAQANLEQSIASKVRREVAWLQRGARARQTKAQARIDEAGRLMDELAEVKF